MKKAIPAGIGIGIIIVIIYFAGFGDTGKFLEIIDYEIIANENSPLFLSVMVSENIPEKTGINNSGYGFAL